MFYLEYYKYKRFKEIRVEREKEKAMDSNNSPAPNNQTQKKNNEESVSVYDLLLSMLKENNLVIFWNFVIGLIAILSWKFNFLYSLQLFSIIGLFPTMQAAIYSVKIKYRQFIAAGFIIVILLLFFATFGVIYYQDEFFNADVNVIYSLFIN